MCSCSIGPCVWYFWWTSYLGEQVLGALVAHAGVQQHRDVDLGDGALDVPQKVITLLKRTNKLVNFRARY